MSLRRGEYSRVRFVNNRIRMHVVDHGRRRPIEHLAVYVVLRVLARRELGLGLRCARKVLVDSTFSGSSFCSGAAAGGRAIIRCRKAERTAVPVTVRERRAAVPGARGSTTFPPTFPFNHALTEHDEAYDPCYHRCLRLCRRRGAHRYRRLRKVSNWFVAMPFLRQEAVCPRLIIAHRRIGCNTLAVACYNAAGSTFGTVTAEDASPALVACNGALGTCHQACANVTLAVSTS
jgi:hypothetical protein